VTNEHNRNYQNATLEAIIYEVHRGEEP